MTLWRTLRFFRILLTKPPKIIVAKTIQLPINNHTSLETDIYPNSGNYAGTILFVHGMNKHGKNDARINHFCQCLATIGYRVIVPTYPMITQHIFSLASIDELADTILALTENKQLCPKNKIAIFTVSFSGTLSLGAASRQNTHKRVSAFFTIGSGFYVNDVFKLGIERAEQDSYMKMICVKNVLRNDPNVSKEIIDLMDIIINDAFLPDEPAQLPEALLSASSKTQNFLKKITGEESNTAFLYPQYKDYLLQLETDLLANSNSEFMTFPIVLIHSKDDQVIPAQETLHYSTDLTKQNVNHKMLITTLIDHVDHNVSLKKIFEIIKLFRLFNLFFKNV